ncbi:MAG: sulfotransferase domain-containing protein [Anaerolineales bacterium]|nr:sulfotransferase domain-containing protein [Anaerolineales bacterium]
MTLRRTLRDIYKSELRFQATLKGALGVGSLPDFIIIGAQKAGTSSLHQYLIEHPQILGANMKEVHFFSTHYQRGMNWYRGCFPSKRYRERRSRELGKPVIAGEASPVYLFHPLAAQRIADALPNVKLIVLLRNPINRLISNYHHMRRIGKETLPLADAVAQEETRRMGDLYFAYKARGRYIEQLERYAQYFKKEQMLILNSERFFADTQTEYDKVVSFLGAESRPLRNVEIRNQGTYKKEKLDDEFYRMLKQYFEPYNERLYEFLGERYDW